MYKIKYLISLLIFALCLPSFAASKGVAKVIKARGKVYDVKTKSKLKKGDWIKEGAKILTKNRSFVKLLFIDKSKMSLGPNSQMIVTKFPKKKAGIITLMKGQLRSQVTKNYMKMTDKEKSKLFIRTKTAAMGVRGTDFQVNYNPKNRNTSLITFEGAVAMGAIGDIKRGLNQARLEKIVSSPTAVMVKRGQFSGVMPSVDTKPISPIKINKKQLKTLEKNDGSKTSNKKDKKKKPKKLAVRSVLPPGMASDEFAGAGKKEIIKEMIKVDQNVAKLANNEFENTNLENNDGPIGDDKKLMKEGGLIDTNNVLYIPPPKDAAIDPMTKQPIIPLHFGTIDPTTGSYQNDYYELKPDGTFVAIVTEDGRGPASTDLPPPPPPVLLGAAGVDEFNQEQDPSDILLPPPPPREPDVENQQIQQRTKVRFIFNNN